MSGGHGHHNLGRFLAAYRGYRHPHGRARGQTVVHQDCPASGQIAAQTLASMGYTNIAEYEEGKQDWTEAGLPIESDQVAA